MTPVVLFVVVLSLTAVPPGATDEGDDGDSSQDVSEVIARSNAGIRTRLIYDDIAPNMKRNAVPCTARGCKWPKSGRYVTVPYTISSQYSTNERNLIIRTLESFHRSTCVRFQMRASWHRNYIHFFSGSGCWSYLGRQGGQQRVSLYSFYADTMCNVCVKHGQERNFRKVQTNNLGTPYDFQSVMHYSRYAFSKNGQPTIVAKSNPNLNFGRATTLSANDIARVNKLYC